MSVSFLLSSHIRHLLCRRYTLSHTIYCIIIKNLVNPKECFTFSLRYLLFKPDTLEQRREGSESHGLHWKIQNPEMKTWIMKWIKENPLWQTQISTIRAIIKILRMSLLLCVFPLWPRRLWGGGSTFKRIFKGHSWRIAQVSCVLGSESHQKDHKTPPTSSQVV